MRDSQRVGRFLLDSAPYSVSEAVRGWQRQDGATNGCQGMTATKWHAVPSPKRRADYQSGDIFARPLMELHTLGPALQFVQLQCNGMLGSSRP
jgi:hypothetical protein